jgi:hypothetical protein
MQPPGLPAAAPSAAGAGFALPADVSVDPAAVDRYALDLTLDPPPKAPRRRSGDPKLRILPPGHEGEGAWSNASFQSALSDSSLTFCPQVLGFMPTNYWLMTDVTFSDLVTKFFQRKNNANCRFPHKLFNALTIVDQQPALVHLIGVQWVSEKVFRVDKLIFGRLLGIVSIDGGLFHRQGNFPSHGFAELPSADVARLGVPELADIDHDRIRVLYHKGNLFARTSSEDAVTGCKWIAEALPRQ